jgi:hypothetical protein
LERRWISSIVCRFESLSSRLTIIASTACVWRSWRRRKARSQSHEFSVRMQPKLFFLLLSRFKANTPKLLEIEIRYLDNSREEWNGQVFNAGNKRRKTVDKQYHHFDHRYVIANQQFHLAALRQTNTNI